MKKLQKLNSDLKTVWCVLVHFAQIAVGIYGVFRYYTDTTLTLHQAVMVLSVVLVADGVLKFVKLHTR